MPHAILLRALQACCTHAEGKGSCGFGFGEVLIVGSVKLTVPVVSGNRIILHILINERGKRGGRLNLVLSQSRLGCNY